PRWHHQALAAEPGGQRSRAGRVVLLVAHTGCSRMAGGRLGVAGGLHHLFGGLAAGGNAGLLQTFVVADGRSMGRVPPRAPARCRTRCVVCVIRPCGMGPVPAASLCAAVRGVVPAEDAWLASRRDVSAKRAARCRLAIVVPVRGAAAGDVAACRDDSCCLRVYTRADGPFPACPEAATVLGVVLCVDVYRRVCPLQVDLVDPRTRRSSQTGVERGTALR